MLFFITVITLLQTALVAAKCQSFGIDYQDGKDYYLSKASPADFTAFQKFQGCSNDKAYNVLVDPNGDQSECSQTGMTPNGMPQQMICSGWTYNKMYTGDWSIIVISNNGNQDPITYQRDFHIQMVEGPLVSSVAEPAQPISTPAAAPAQSSRAAAHPLQSSSRANADLSATIEFSFPRKRQEAQPTTFSRVIIRSETLPSFLAHKKSSSFSAEPTATVETTTGTGIAPNGLLHPTGLVKKEVPRAVSVPTPTLVSGATQTGASTDHVAEIVPQSLPHELLQIVDRVLSGSEQYTEILSQGGQPSDELKRLFVEERKNKLHGL